MIREKHNDTLFWFVIDKANSHIKFFELNKVNFEMMKDGLFNSCTNTKLILSNQLKLVLSNWLKKVKRTL